MMTANTAWLAIALCFIAGCQPEATIAPVSGTVTLDGKPLPGVHVSFEPIAPEGKLEAGGGSYAITDSAGKYTLLMVDGERPGAVVGKHRVEFTARNVVADDIDLPARPPPAVKIPEQYGRNSKLTFAVLPGGTPSADFNLQSR